VPRRDIVMLWRIVWRLAVRQPHAVWPFLKLFYWCIANFPGALPAVGMFTAFYLHVGPFSRFVMKAIERQIAEIDAGQWTAPIADTQELTRAGILVPGATVDLETAEPAEV
jgi:cytochrome b561